MLTSRRKSKTSSKVRSSDLGSNQRPSSSLHLGNCYQHRPRFQLFAVAVVVLNLFQLALANPVFVNNPSLAHCKYRLLYFTIFIFTLIIDWKFKPDYYASSVWFIKKHHRFNIVAFWIHENTNYSSLTSKQCSNARIVKSVPLWWPDTNSTFQHPSITISYFEANFKVPINSPGLHGSLLIGSYSFPWWPIFPFKLSLPGCFDSPKSHAKHISVPHVTE